MKRPLGPVFACAAVIFAVYAAFVQFAPFTVAAGQNQNDTNLIRAQEYLARPQQGTMLVGSSLIFRLPSQTLGPDVANLAIAGGAPATGLALIEQSATRPRLVLVEINLLTRAPDDAMVNSLLRFPERELRRHLRVFRTGYDPVNLAWRGVAALAHKNDYEGVPPPDVVRRLTAEQRQSMAHPPDLARLRSAVAQAAALVSRLQARGIRVGFFEMPLNADLMTMPGESVIREEALRTFPKQNFCWLTLDVPGGAHTLDGIHLTVEDADLVARQVTAQRGACLSRQILRLRGAGARN